MRRFSASVARMTSFLAVAKTEPAVPRTAHLELVVIVTAMKGTCPAQVVAAPIQLIEYSVAVENLIHRDRPLQLLEAEESLVAVHSLSFLLVSTSSFQIHRQASKP